LKQRFTTKAGSLVLSESSGILPVVGISVSARTGALFDPPGKEGLTRVMTRAMRMGTSELRSRQLEEQLDRLGAQLAMTCSQSYMHFGGVVVAHNLVPFVELLSSLLERPAFRPSDVRQVQRELLAELAALGDDDRALCSRNFRSYAFGAHPYARPRSGTLESLRAIGLGDVVEHHARHVTGKNLVIGVWGDFVPKQLPGLLERSFGRLPSRRPPSMVVPEPALQPGSRVLLVDKPDRTQTQILIGTLGTSPHDRDYVPLVVANTAFGGLFTSRLTEEVRGKRGLSYGVSSSFTLSRTRHLWSMHTFPAAKDARMCIELQLGLYERWVKRGLLPRELSAAKRYLEKSHAFETDTAAKRLDQRLDIELLGWPKTHHSGFVDRVKRVTRDDVLQALHRRLSLRDRVITIVATGEQLAPELASLADAQRIDVVPFDRI
jgi:zinc protease